MAGNTIRTPLPNTFDRTEKTLREGATELRQEAKAELKQAGTSMDRAGERVQDAYGHVADAGDNALRAAVAGAEGSGHFLAGVGYSAEGVAHATASGAGRVAHLAKETVEVVGRAASRFFEKLAKVFARMGNENLVTTRSIRNTDDALKAFYELQGQMAKQGFTNASQEFRSAWTSWGEAMVASIEAGGDLIAAGANITQAAGNVAQGLGHVAAAGAAETAALVSRLAEASVNAAQEGVIGAADLAAVTAKFLGGMANVVSLDTQPKIEVGLQQQVALLRESLQALAKQHPELAPKLLAI